MPIRSFILFFLFQITSAQEFSFVGEVRSNKQPLEGVSVILKGSNLGTITNSKGQFKLYFTNLKNPRLIFSHIGYKPIEIKIKSNNLNLGTIILESDDRLDEVVVSGTLKPVSRLDSSIPVEVYARTFFKANPTASIFEALENINGIRPQLNCNVCNTGDIHINGQEGSYTMVLIDGLPIVSGLSTVYGLSGIPKSLIERVEIIKGPASTLYGSEAIGGVINLITRLPENTSKFSVDSFLSGWGEVNTDIGYKYNLTGNNSGLLGINYFNYSNPIDNNQDGFTDLTLQDRISIFSKLTLGTQFSVATRFVYEDRWGGQMNWSPEYRGGDILYGESIYTSRFEIFGEYKFNSRFSFSFSFNDHNQNSFYGLIPFNADQTVGFGQFFWDKKIKKHDILFGLSYRYTYYDDDTTATFDELLQLNRETISHLPGIFIQDEIKLNSQNTLLLGLRYDYNSIYGNIITPRFNYKISNEDRTKIFRLSIGSGYRVAQVFTEDHAALTGARDVIFLEDLDPERSWNINGNFLKKLYLKQGAIIDFDISIFHTRFSNKIIPDYDSDPNKIIYTNLYGSSVNQGASFNINLLIQNGIRVNLGATYIDSYIEDQDLRITPYLTESFQGVWKVKKKWKVSNLTLDITGTTTGPLKLPTLGPLDPRPNYSSTFHILNFQLTKSWNNAFETYSGIKNLLDFTPSVESIARSFDPFDKAVTFNVQGDALSTQNNPFALTFDPSYVYASNQGIRFFFGLRLKLD